MYTITQLQALFDSQRLPRKTQSLEWYLEQVNAGQNLYRLDFGDSGEDDTIAATDVDTAAEIVGDYALECGFVVETAGRFGAEPYTSYEKAGGAPDDNPTPFEATGWTLTAIEIADTAPEVDDSDDGQYDEKARLLGPVDSIPAVRDGKIVDLM